jgi:hypothetical protein
MMCKRVRGTARSSGNRQPRLVRPGRRWRLSSCLVRQVVRISGRCSRPGVAATYRREQQNSSPAAIAAIADCGGWVNGLRITDYGLRSTEHGLRIVDCGRGTVGCVVRYGFATPRHPDGAGTAADPEPISDRRKRIPASWQSGHCSTRVHPRSMPVGGRLPRRARVGRDSDMEDVVG